MQDDMNNEVIIQTIASKIVDFFENGIPAGNGVIRFAKSALGLESVPEICLILSSGDEYCEGLCGLLLYPDDNLRLVIEPFVPAQGLTNDETEKIVGYIAVRLGKVRIIFNDTHQGAEIYLSESIIRTFMQRLNLGKKLDWVVDFSSLSQSAMKIYFTAKATARKSDYHSTPEREKLLCRMAMGLAESGDGIAALESVDFMLRLFGEVKEERDILLMVSEKRNFLEECLNGMIEFRNEMRKSSMEVLMLRRVSAPAMNVEEIRENIRIADNISQSILF